MPVGVSDYAFALIFIFSHKESDFTIGKIEQKS